VNLVDSSGWLEYFAAGPNADFFAPPIEAVAELIVPTISLYEVFKIVRRQRGDDPALQAITLMRQGLVIDLSVEVAVSAANASLQYGIPMADSIILATAQAHDATLYTQDVDFRNIEGVAYIERKPS